MSYILVEGVTDRLALEAVSARTGADLSGVEIVPIGGAQAIRRAAPEYDGELCDRDLERQLRRWLRSGDGRSSRYPPLLVHALEPDEIPASLTGVLAAAAF